MLAKIERLITHIFEYIGMSLLLGMTIIVCITVVTRYLLGFTPSWGEEGALLCMIWFGFLSMALGVRDDLHLSITILDYILPQGVISLLNIIKRFFVLAFAVFMIVEGSNMTEIGLGNDLPGIQISSAFLYAAVPISGIAIFCYSITGWINDYKMLRGGKG